MMFALECMWKKLLPLWTLPDFLTISGSDRLQRGVSRAFSELEVRKTKRHISNLVCTTMDKAPGAVLLWCPHMYGEKYAAAFSEQSDPAHFEKCFDSEEECVAAMRKDYKSVNWRYFGDWDYSGSIPEHYIMPKHKDIVADCSEVYRKKKQCCRVRPILPYTKHYLRKAFKRGGKALGLLVSLRLSPKINSLLIVRGR